MGYVVDVTTGVIVAQDDFGNLAEWLNALVEVGMDTGHLKLYFEDDVYAEVA